MRVLGFSKFWIGYFTSDQRVDISTINKAISVHTSETAFCYYEVFQDLETAVQYEIRLFQDTKGLKARAVKETTWLEGRYLVLVLPYDTDDKQMDITQRVASILGAVRTLFGDWVAKDRHMHLQIDPIKNAQIWEAAGKYVMPLRHPLYPVAVEEADLEKIEINISQETINLLNLANDYDNNNVFFSLCWIALEVQIGDGKKRRHFCLDELKSQAVNDEMEALAEIRHRIFHDGEQYMVTARDRYCLQALFLLAVLPRGEVRDRILKSFQTVIDAHPASDATTTSTDLPPLLRLDTERANN